MSSARFSIRVFVFDVDLYEFFVYVGYLPLIKNIICSFLLPFSKLSFHFVENLVSFLCCAESFQFDAVPFIFAFVAFVFSVKSKRITAKVDKVYFMFSFESCGFRFYVQISSTLNFFFLFFLLGIHLQDMEVPRRGIKLDL